MQPIDLLLKRNSHGKLEAPAPAGADLEKILKAGLRAPDHAHLRPWRFVIIEGERRDALGQAFYESQVLRGVTDQAILTKSRKAPYRAPMIIAGILEPKPHPKVPRGEQVASVACALHAMALAAEALGFGALWRTGSVAVDPHVISVLGGAPGEEVIGFLYMGTKIGPGKNLPEVSVGDFVSYF